MYIENLIDDLQALASKEFQKVAWFENNQGLSASYGSSVSDLFDDHNLKEILHEKGAVLINTKVHQALQELYAVVDNVGYNKSQEEIIDSPEMQIVREKAASILELIKASDGSESTVDFVKVGTSDVKISIQDAFKSASLLTQYPI